MANEIDSDIIRYAPLSHRIARRADGLRYLASSTSSRRDALGRPTRARARRRLGHVHVPSAGAEEVFSYGRGERNLPSTALQPGSRPVDGDVVPEMRGCNA
nr:unnamed protein product [Digitaria exilis]